MATSWLKPLHVGELQTIYSALRKVIDYAKNPSKTGNENYVTGYECDPQIADKEFMLSKKQYFAITGRTQGEKDVIAYHTRQAFKPNTITPEEANCIGYELAMTLTKGKNAFIVSTHIDKKHVHNVRPDRAISKVV